MIRFTHFRLNYVELSSLESCLKTGDDQWWNTFARWCSINDIKCEGWGPDNGTSSNYGGKLPHLKPWKSKPTIRPPFGLSSTRRRRCCPVATYATRFGPSTATPLGRKRLEDTAKPPSPEVFHPSMVWRWRFFAPPSCVCMNFSLWEVVVLWTLLEKNMWPFLAKPRAYERMRFATSSQSTSAWFHYPSCDWVLLVASVKIEQIGSPFTAKLFVIFGTLNSFATSSATSSIISTVVPWYFQKDSPILN